MRASRRWSRRTTPLAIGAVLVALLVIAPTTRAATVGGQARGDSYALRLSGAPAPTPWGVGPMFPVDARVPPETTASRRSGTVSCGGTAAACPAAAVGLLQVTGDEAVATLDTHGVDGCPLAGAAVSGRQVSPRLVAPGASGCATVARLDLLHNGPVQVAATAVVSRSQTQGCSAWSGATSIGTLKVAGTTLVTGPEPFLPRPDETMVVPPGATGAAVMATVVLDEQIPDADGHGLTVNGVHLRPGPAARGLAADVVVGHTHSAAVCPPPEVRSTVRPGVRWETLPGGATVAVSDVDPAADAVEAAVAGGSSPACFGDGRRGGGCHEPVAALVERGHALLGVTANFTDGTHALGAVIVDHRALTPNDPHTTSLCVGDLGAAGVPVTVVPAAAPSTCRTAVSGERLLSGGRVDIQGLADDGRRGAFWWSVRPRQRTSRTLVGVRGDGDLVVAAAGPSDGRTGGLTLFEAAAWLARHGARDAIALDGGGQTDMVLGGGRHAVPLRRGPPVVQVALLVRPEPPPLPAPTPAPAPSPAAWLRDTAAAERAARSGARTSARNH